MIKNILRKSGFLVKENYKTPKMRGGFTLIELIVVMIVLAVLVGIAIVKIMNSSKETEIKDTLRTDISQIVRAANNWRQNDTGSDGTYNNITTGSLCDYLPNNMQCDNNYIYSSNFHDSTGKGRIEYKIASDKLSTNGDSFKIFVDASPLASANHWEARFKSKIEKLASNVMKKSSTQPNSYVEVRNATDIGNPNDNFNTDGGSNTDAKVGGRYITTQ